MSLFAESIVIAEERIDFQNDSFGSDLEVLVSQLMADVASGEAKGNLDKYPVIAKMETLILRRLGLKVNLITNKYLAAVFPFYSNKNHIFLDAMIRGQLSLPDQNKAIKNFESNEGSVNLKSAKVSGIFSEYEHPVFVNFRQLIEMKFENYEITAIILHELGHAFSACYYSDRTDRTNQVLANVHRVITGTRTDKDLEYVYREISKLTENVKKEEIDTIMNGTRVVAGATWFKLMIRVVRSQMSDDKYNDSSFEEMADSFAGRFGYGKALALSLDRLHGEDYNKNHSSLALCYVMDFACIAGMVGMVLGGIAMGAFMPFIFGVYMSLSYVALSGEDAIDYTYDDLKNRHKRIRNNIVEQLKDSDLDPKLVKTILENVYAVDAAIETTYQYRNLGTKINNLIFKNSRASFNSIDSQQLMEALSANDLFVKSAEFKTL